MCIDYRTVNKYLVRDNQPLTLIEDQLDMLKGKGYFTVLDLKDGFYYVRTADDSVKYTAFVTPFGQYDYSRLPFGLKVAPAKFTRIVNKVLKEIIKTGEVITYMDDFMVAMVTLEHHMQVLQKNLKLLVKNKLELRIDKSKFSFTKIEYLGYLISEGIQPTDSGLEAVKLYRIPKCVWDVRKFLGLYSFFRKFIENFSIIAKALYDLTRKDVKCVLKEKELAAFETLKLKLTQAPILAIYNPRDESNKPSKL